jgi:hypothetical protein
MTLPVLFRLYECAVAVSGTSAACPVVAAMVSLVNTARLEAGQPTLGWLNPTLYSVHTAAASASFVNDIVEGSNHCAAGGVVCCDEGFRAAPGWDPVTGLGSLNFAKFKATMMEVTKNYNKKDEQWLRNAKFEGIPMAPEFVETKQVEESQAGKNFRPRENSLFMHFTMIEGTNHLLHVYHNKRKQN